MKNYATIVFAVALCLSIAMVVSAQQPQPEDGRDDYNYCPHCGADLNLMPGEDIGYGLGPGMMHQGWGRGPGMMGRGKADYRQDAECQMFLNDTVEERRKLHEKRFEYSEAYRDPKTTDEEMMKLEQEIEELRSRIIKKAPRKCW
jgi:hypothetical protein